MLLTIEKLIYGGDGLARLPADEHGRGKAVFLPFVLAEEKVEAHLTEHKPGFVRAQVDAVVEPSPHRVHPACPYFGQCGGCHYQHASYEHQLEIKAQILRETLRRTAKLELDCDLEIHPSTPWNYRNRSRLQIQPSPFAAGYFKLASHELLPVEQCPISSPLINRGIAALWQIGRSRNFPEGVSEVEFFANADDSQLLTELSCASDVPRAAVRALADELRSAMPEIAGVTAFRENRAGGVSTRLSFGATDLVYRSQFARSQFANYRVSAGSFFQTNRYLTDELVKIVVRGQSGGLALDLYSGVGLFSTALARDFYHIVSVESSQTSSSDLAYNLPPNGKAVQATTEQYLAHANNADVSKARAGNPGWVGKGTGLSQSPDLVVVDPPRSGLGERVARQLATLRAPRLTYVSCDPATLARDLVVLLAAGYRVEELHLVDLFPQTYHLESVVHLQR